VPELTGHYDLLIATDVFEHVPDPIGLAASTASHLRIGGHYLIANCFAPVMKCHLPSTFHLRITWNFIINKLGLIPSDRVVYGRSFKRAGAVNLDLAQKFESRSRQLTPFTSMLPERISWLIT